MTVPRARPEMSDPVAWVTRMGIAGAQEIDLLNGFCERAIAAGVPLTRAQILIDTLHPIHEGRVFRWRAGVAGEMVEYGRISEDEVVAGKWRQSPFYHLEQTGEPSLRRSLESRGEPDFPVLAEFRAAGQTDYLAYAQRFSDGLIGEMDCVYSSWTTDASGGFSEGQVEALTNFVPALALAIKCASLARVATTLAETYLGRDAGQRVLRGAISRGIPERVDAVLWFSDLRNFTRISDSVAPEQIIPLLNDYAEALISAIHEAGGEVLKLIGDGMLAIFRGERRGEACRQALAAEAEARRRVDMLNQRRTQQGLTVTEFYLGLAIGEVFYGNIGSSDRLDFTVVGPAVNEASRIAAMCRSIDRSVLVSARFAAAADDDQRSRLVSVGRYALRGIREPQDLFTLDPTGSA